jgi:hypothetical protein
MAIGGPGHMGLENSRMIASFFDGMSRHNPPGPAEYQR